MSDLTSSSSIGNILLQNRLLTEEIRRRVDQLSAINSVAAMVGQSLDLDKTLESALDSVLQVIPVAAAGISLLDTEAGELVLRAQRGWKQDFVSKPMRMKLGQGLSGYVIANDELVVTGDVSNDPRIAVSAFMEEQVKAMALAPMHARGRIIGIVSVMNYQPYDFSEEQTDVLRAIADQLGVALDNARLYEDARAKQSRLSAIIDSTADAIIATDGSGLVNLVNHAAEAMLGLRADYIIGKPLQEVFLNPQMAAGVARLMAEMPQQTSFFEVTLDSERQFSVTVTRVHSRDAFQERWQLPDDDFTHTGWLVVVQDITHLRDSERNRVRFIQTAAHDLRNPLSMTMSALTYLKNAHEQPTESTEIIDMAMNSIDRMQNLIDDLLNLERIQSRADFRTQLVNIADLLERGMLEIQPAIQHKRQVFYFEGQPDLPEVNGDSRWLGRALANLLSNASKYTPAEGEITLRSWAKGDEVFIEVEDTGIGITLANQKRVFDNFYREPRVQDTIPGTGLGLSIVKSVVEQHGGRVYVTSREGEGSLFGMILPIAD